MKQRLTRRVSLARQTVVFEGSDVCSKLSEGMSKRAVLVRWLAEWCYPRDELRRVD